MEDISPPSIGQKGYGVTGLGTWNVQSPELMMNAFEWYPGKNVLPKDEADPAPGTCEERATWKAGDATAGQMLTVIHFARKCLVGTRTLRSE